MLNSKAMITTILSELSKSNAKIIESSIFISSTVEIVSNFCHTCVSPNLITSTKFNQFEKFAEDLFAKEKRKITA